MNGDKNMSSVKASEFLKRHGMNPELVEPARDAVKMAEDMERGLQGQRSSMPMIPTYLSDSGRIPQGVPAAVIDAGGTNFRSALVTFDGDGYRVEELRKWKMPGIGKPATWEEFIAFAADSIQPLMEKTDTIGFCFSYSADITPEIDGKVQRIDKEVVITGCEGQLVGASLLAELERRGIHGKQIVILNDTVAVLLGGLATVDPEKYSGFIGQVSGTGTNTCCSLPQDRITKLGQSGEKRIIVNLESGMYDGTWSPACMTASPRATLTGCWTRRATTPVPRPLKSGLRVCTWVNSAGRCCAPRQRRACSMRLPRRRSAPWAGSTLR